MAADRRVLLLEDEIVISLYLEDVLSSLGWTIAHVADRIENALETVEAGEIDAAVLDINIAGKPSFPVAERLAAQGVPFLFLTGYGARGVPERFQDRPILQKPVAMKTLSAALDRLAVQ